MRLIKIYGWRQRIGLIFLGLLMVAVALSTPVKSWLDEIRLVPFGILGVMLIVGCLTFRRDVWQAYLSDDPEDEV